MLLTGKAEDGTRILGRKTLELMHTNHLAPALLPYALAGVAGAGYGFGLGSRVAMDIGQSALAGSPASSAGPVRRRPTTGSTRSRRSSACS
jgi:hypothetical protein